MFHVLLVLPALITFGAFAIFIWFAPFFIGMFLQFVLSIVAEKLWIRCIPAGLGMIGLTWCLYVLLPELPVLYILIYWAVYFLLLWLTWLVVDQIKKFIARHRSKE